MFDFNGEKAPKLFLNETDGTVAKDYASIEKVDNTSREISNLKPVAEGMNNPLVTENGVAEVAKMVNRDAKPGAQQPGKDDPAGEQDGSSTGGIIAAVVAVLAVLGGIGAWVMNGMPGLPANIKDSIKLPF